MAEFDYVLKGVKVSVEGVVNITALYKLIRNWFDKMKYDFYEKEHIEGMKAEDAKDLNVKIETEKNIDDYTKLHIELRMKGKELKPVMRGKELCVSGAMSIGFDVFIENDYEGRWDSPFFLKFFRTVYDKYVMSEREQRNMAEVREEAEDLISKTKSFLKVEEFKR